MESYLADIVESQLYQPENQACNQVFTASAAETARTVRTIVVPLIMPPPRRQPWPTSEPSAPLTAISSTRRQSPGATSSGPAGLPQRGNGVRRDRARVSSVIRMGSCSCPKVPTFSSPTAKTRGFNFDQVGKFKRERTQEWHTLHIHCNRDQQRRHGGGTMPQIGSCENAERRTCPARTRACSGSHQCASCFVSYAVCLGLSVSCSSPSL